MADPRRVDRIRQLLAQVDPIDRHGFLRAQVGMSLRARVPGVRVGELVEIQRSNGPALPAEVVGFSDQDVLLTPLGPVHDLGPRDRVEARQCQLQIACSEALLGRVLNGLGQPLDDGPALSGEAWAVNRPPPHPLHRPRIDQLLFTGVRAIDGLLTLGEGQRIGLFAGSGVGKTTLLGQIARQAKVDVFVACLIGERGRELREFLDDALGDSGRSKGVIVCSTSDTPALVRTKSAAVATSIAEWFRDRGARVLLLMDSLTRLARASREVGLAAGELPVRRGYPPSVFAALPPLLERCGRSSKGSITAIYTVLVEGGDLEEPIADEVRSLLDGHIVLDRELAARGHFPAIDPLRSLSRLMDGLVDPAHRRAAATLRGHLSHYEAKRDLVLLGAYQKGSDPRLDDALRRLPAIEAFLRQSTDQPVDFAATRQALLSLVGEP